LRDEINRCRAEPVSCEGADKVRQEAKLWAISYNVAQWIRLAWSKARKPALQPVAVAC
jgi:hypothetical protein